MKPNQPIPSFMMAVLALAFANPAFAQAQQPSLARQVADGKPWAMTMLQENRKATVTLRPDGTGHMEGGPMPMSPTWRETADGICLKPAVVAPERCSTLRREGKAIIGYRDGAPQFRLER